MFKVRIFICGLFNLHDMKECRNCKNIYSLEDYHKDKNKKDGHRNVCKSCIKKYRKDNWDKIKIKDREWKANNKERINKREQTEKRKVQKKEAVKRLLEKNPNYFTEYARRRKQEKPETRIRLNLSNRIIKALKKNVKSQKTMELLGIDIDSFKKYIESKFLPTMTWENYGKEWHIDHIRPCKSYDLTIPEQQKECFHYTNLQPLFKNNRVIDGVFYLGNLNKQAKVV